MTLPSPHPGSQQTPSWQQPGQGQPQRLAQPSWTTAQPTAAAPQPRGNPLGLVALAVAVVLLLLGVVALVAQAVAIQGGSPQAVGAVSTAFNVVHIVLALAGVALAIVGLVQRDRRRTIAAIALGANAAIAASTLTGLLTFPIFALLG